MRNVILADNQDITRVGIECLLTRFSPDISIEYAVDKSEIIAGLKNQPSSFVILDYTYSDFGSVDELLILNQRFADANWLLFSEDLNGDFLRRLLFNSNAFSVVLKTSEIDEINASLKHVLRNERFICGKVTSLLISSNKTTGEHIREVLTVREREILKEIALGKTTKEIAAEQILSFHTINTHRKNIFRKLDVNNIQEAIKYAIRAGIIDVADYYI